MAASVRARQHALNEWTKKFLRGVTPIAEDGIAGQHTHARIMAVKYYLGYDARNGSWTRRFELQMWHPHTSKYFLSGRKGWLKGQKRRVEQRARWAREKRKANVNGTRQFDGKAVASWIVPWAERARSRGLWHGQVISGYRTPAYSRYLCERMCGAPTCPGRCAGTTSNHTKLGPNQGAIDVTDYVNFANAMHVLGAPLQNQLSADHPHFSYTGH